MMLSPEFTPDTHPSPHAVQDADKAALCRVRIGDVHDLRDDNLTMGAYGEFTLRATDTASWVRAGLQSLNRDQRLLVDDATQDSSALVLNADLLKAYVMDSAQEARATNVVVRVHFSRQGAVLGEKTYRGADAGLNWTGSKGETQSSLNDALNQIVDAVDQDVMGYCGPAASAATTQ
jgi:hypothetical protein